MIADTWVDSIGAMCGLLAGYMIRYRCYSMDVYHRLYESKVPLLFNCYLTR